VPTYKALHACLLVVMCQNQEHPHWKIFCFIKYCLLHGLGSNLSLNI